MHGSAGLEQLGAAGDEIAAATEQIITRSKTDPAEIGAASYAYMEALGTFLYGYMWARILATAVSDSNGTGYSETYRDALLQVGRFFFARLLPRYRMRLEELSGGAETLMALRAEQF